MTGVECLQHDKAPIGPINVRPSQAEQFAEAEATEECRAQCQAEPVALQCGQQRPRLVGTQCAGRRRRDGRAVDGVHRVDWDCLPLHRVAESSMQDVVNLSHRRRRQRLPGLPVAPRSQGLLSRQYVGWLEALHGDVAEMRYEIPFNDLSVAEAGPQCKRWLDVIPEPAMQELAHRLLARIDVGSARHSAHMGSGFALGVLLGTANREGASLAPAGLGVSAAFNDDFPRPWLAPMDAAHPRSTASCRLMSPRIAQVGQQMGNVSRITRPSDSSLRQILYSKSGTPYRIRTDDLRLERAVSLTG